MSDSSDPMDCNPPGSSVHGIFQAKVLEWGAIAFSSQWIFHSYIFLLSFWAALVCTSGITALGGGGGSVTKLCPTCEPMDGSLPGSSVHGILQARILEWVAIWKTLFSGY